MLFRQWKNYRLYRFGSCLYVDFTLTQTRTLHCCCCCCCFFAFCFFSLLSHLCVCVCVSYSPVRRVSVHRDGVQSFVELLLALLRAVPSRNISRKCLKIFSRSVRNFHTLARARAHTHNTLAPEFTKSADCCLCLAHIHSAGDKCEVCLEYFN